MYHQLLLSVLETGRTAESRSRLNRESSCDIALLIGVIPFLLGLLGFSVKGAKYLITSRCPKKAASWIGVPPYMFGVLGFSVRGAKNLMTSKCPSLAAWWIGVSPSSNWPIVIFCHTSLEVSVEKNHPAFFEGRWYTGKMARQIWAEWAVCLSSYLWKGWIF